MSLRNYLLRRGDQENDRYKLFISSVFGYLKKHCGLESYAKGITSNTMIDKVGKSGTESGRDAVQGRTILGDGSTWLDLDIDVQDDSNWYWEVEGNFADTSNGWNGNRNNDGSQRFIWGIQDSKWFLGYKDDGSAGAIASDTDNHIFKITGDGKLFVDGDLINDKHTATGSLSAKNLFLLAANYSTKVESNFNCKSCRIHLPSGITYTLDINPDNNVYSLILSDNSAQIDVQQYLAPATPTEVNITQEDVRDLYGYTVATGTETRDSAGLSAYTVGYKIPNYSNGLSVGYIAGEHFAGTFSGRVKYNYSIVGDVFKVAEKYNGMIVDDTSHIFYDASGNINTLSWAGMSNITNEQLFINKTTNQVGFFENALTPGTDCYDKAVFFMGLADQLFDSLASPLEDSTNDKLYSTT